MSGKEIEIINDDDPYTMVLNELIFDETLRLQARMVLIMMTSFRPDWDFSVRGMAAIAHVTKDTMSKMLAELEEAGYVRRKEQPRSVAGRFAKAGYLVSRKPIFKESADTEHKNYDTEQPCHNLPYPVEPYTKNSSQLNTKQPTTKQSTSPCSPPGGDGAPADPETGAPIEAQRSGFDGERRHSGADELSPQGEASARSLCRRADKPAAAAKRPRREKSAPDHNPEAFEIFWEAYPRKDARKKAIQAWDKLKADRPLCRVMYAALKRQRGCEQWAEDGGKYIPLFSTWLNGRKWEDRGVDLSLLDQPQSGGSWADAPD